MNIAIVFVKEPVPGRVKTRLCPPLSHAQAASLYSAFARDTLAALAQAPDVLLDVAYEARPGSDPTSWLGPRAARWFPQHGADLGERMNAAFERAFAQGARRALIVGSDLPDLTPESVEQAFELLRTKDVVLGPAEDGGYYLVGLSRPVPELFRAMTWSVADVLARTLERAGRLDLTHALIDPRRDVDTLGDLHALRGRLTGTHRCEHTRWALLELETVAKGAL